MSRGVNDKSTFDGSGVTDTSEYDLPNVDGGDDPYDARTEDTLVAYVTNNQDTALTARLERAGALDEAFSNEVTDTSGVSVPSGETKAIAADPDVPLAFFRVVYAFDSDPNGDNSVHVEFNSDQRGE